MCLMYGVTSHAFPTFLLVYPSQFTYKHLYPNECPRLGNVQMRSCRVGKREREDKTGHEKYDIRLLKKKKKIIIVSELSKLAQEHLDQK